MEEENFEDQSQAESQSLGVEQALDHLKETLHQLKLQDAIHRQEIRKLEKNNDKYEKKIDTLKGTISGLEKQKATDETYLMKQQEIITKAEMNEEMEKALDPSQNTKTSKSANTGIFDLVL